MTVRPGPPLCLGHRARHPEPRRRSDRPSAFPVLRGGPEALPGESVEVRLVRLGERFPNPAVPEFGSSRPAARGSSLCTMMST